MAERLVRQARSAGSTPGVARYVDERFCGLDGERSAA